MLRYHHNLLPWVYQIIISLPIWVVSQFDIHDRNTSQEYDLHVNQTNTKLTQNNIKTHGPLTWHIKNESKH